MIIRISVFFVSVVVHARNEGQEVGGIVGGQVTLTCDLPTSDPPQIAWMDNVWNMGRGQEPIFNSSVGSEIAEGHRNRQNMEVRRRTERHGMRTL